MTVTSVVFAQRNVSAADYDSALIDLLEAAGATVTVETGSLSSIDWSGHDLLIIGAPGTSYVGHQNASEIAGYPVAVMSLCRHTSRVALQMANSSSLTSASTYTRATYASNDPRAKLESYGLLADGGDAACHRISDHAWPTWIIYHHSADTTYAGVAEAPGPNGYRRIHHGFYQLHIATDEARQSFLRFAFGVARDPFRVVNDLTAFAIADTQARASMPSPVGSLAGWLDVASGALARLPSPVGGLRAAGVNDWSTIIDPLTTQTYYACDLESAGGETVRVPISSWQGTLQQGRASFLQAVVPAADSRMADINNADEFVIRRGARFEDGTILETDMARAPINTIQYNEGPTNSTATLRGHMQMAEMEGSANRNLQGLRSWSTSPAIRARSAIDWFLRPGMTCHVGGASFTAGFINYYVNITDQYMDVGEGRL
ncbi:hypothetical protein LWH94_15850 [Marinobacter sp. G11]|uniref:hypothetical protein n=1 Tax=Marinobacter sp. G11 TaxID=2903522 RepID=UPI001E591500|nr:hypothetical protein [Marinobacter sp. G11]MCE0760665.1 hypothetical protein [Marinobacter sp. G11]